MRVALTQSDGRLEGLAPRLRDAGFEVVRVPLLVTKPLLDDETRSAAESLLGLPWRSYASRSAVEAWVELGLPFDDGARLAAVGHGTAAALERARGHPAPAAGERAGVGPAVSDVLTPAPSASSALGLASVLLAAGAAGSEVGLVQGRRARPELAERLRRGGAKTREAVVYEVTTLPWRVSGSLDAVLLTSPSAAAALPEEVARDSTLVALGPTTRAALHERGWHSLQAPEPSVTGVLEALERLRIGAAALRLEAGG